MGEIGEEEEEKRVLGPFTGKRQSCSSAGPLNLIAWENRTRQLGPDRKQLGTNGSWAQGPSRENPSLSATATR